MKKIISTILLLFYFTSSFGFAQINHICSMALSNGSDHSDTKCNCHVVKSNESESNSDQSCCSTESNQNAQEESSCCTVDNTENTDNTLNQTQDGVIQITSNCCSFEINVKNNDSFTFPTIEKTTCAHHSIDIAISEIQLFNQQLPVLNINASPLIFSINLPLLI